MIARVTLPGSGVVAELGDDRRWSCPADPRVARLFNARYPATGDGPSAGRVGHAAAAAAAEATGGVATFPPEPSGPPGDVEY